MNRILVLAVLVLAGLGSHAEAQVFRPRSKTGISHPVMTPIVASTAVAVKGAPAITNPTPPKTVPPAASALAKTKTSSATKITKKRRVVKKKGKGDEDDEVVVVDDDDE